MKENLLTKEHRSTNEKYRRGWDRAFRKKGEFVTLECPTCGFRIIAEKYCPVTGHIVGKGWSYRCHNCDDNLKVKE